MQQAFPDILDNAYLQKNTYEVARHALRLACGLESQIVFESQILDQLRAWVKGGDVPPALKILWRMILDLVHDIRFRTGVNCLKKDIVDFMLEDIAERIGILEDKTILIIGTGKVAELVSQKGFASAGLFFAARKRHHRAAKLSRQAKGQLVLFEDLPRMLFDVDIAVSATSSPHYIIKADPGLLRLRHRDVPLYIYDLAVPRDVQPEVSGLENVIVSDMNDVLQLTEVYRRGLAESIVDVEGCIEEILLEMMGGKSGAGHQGRHQAELIGV